MADPSTLRDDRIDLATLSAMARTFDQITRQVGPRLVAGYRLRAMAARRVQRRG
jgi:hypothetical protein